MHLLLQEIIRGYVVLRVRDDIFFHTLVTYLSIECV